MGATLGNPLAGLSCVAPALVGVPSATPLRGLLGGTYGGRARAALPDLASGAPPTNADCTDPLLQWYLANGYIQAWPAQNPYGASIAVGDPADDGCWHLSPKVPSITWGSHTCSLHDYPVDSDIYPVVKTATGYGLPQFPGMGTSSFIIGPKADGASVPGPRLVKADSTYGLVTPTWNVGWTGTRGDAITAALVAKAEGFLPGWQIFNALQSGNIGGALTAAGGALLGPISTMDSTDFVDFGAAAVNNAPGFLDGATDPAGLTSGWSLSTSDLTTAPTVDDLLGNTDAQCYSTDPAGVLDAAGNGTNGIGDPASLTDFPGAPSSPNGSTPRGGGASIPGAGSATGGTMSPAPTATSQAPVGAPPYLPPNPRYLQTAAQAIFNPQGGGTYPIINPTPNPGSNLPYGSVRGSASVSSTGGLTGPPGQPSALALAGLPTTITPTMMLIMGGALLLVMAMMKG